MTLNALGLQPDRGFGVSRAPGGDPFRRVRANARLNQDDLARRLGVSRAPIRDALNRLEAEGLVRTLGRIGGVVVAETSEQEMVDIYELRAIMDSASTRLACDRSSEAALAHLQEIAGGDGAGDRGQRPPANRASACRLPRGPLRGVRECGADPGGAEPLGPVLPLSRPGAQQRGECPSGSGAAPRHPDRTAGPGPRAGRGDGRGARPLQHPAPAQPHEVRRWPARRRPTATATTASP